MNQSTGPPNIEEVVAGLALIGLLSLSLFPLAYVADELNPSKHSAYSKYLK